MRWLIAIVVALSSGCAYLRHTTTDTSYFVTSRECAQGPLRIETTALGSRWGEWLSLEVVSPRAVRGSLRWAVGTERNPLHAWVTHVEVQERDGTRSIVDTRFDHQRCAERPAYLVELPPEGSTPPVVVLEPPVVQPPVTVAPSLPPAAAEPFQPLPYAPGPDVSQVQLVTTTSANPGPHRANLFNWERRNEQKDAPPPLAPGTPIVIELWSETPNDYQGTTFVFTRGAYVPNVSEDEWLVELDKRELEKKKASDEEAAREAERRRLAEIEARREAALATAKARDEAAQRRAHAEELARRPAPTKTDEQRRYEEERRARYAKGLAEPSSADPAYVEQRRIEFERRRAEAAAEAEALRRYHEERQRRWAEAEARRPVPRPPPTSPPPPTPAQSVPFRPAPYLVWIDGYYEWTGSAWVWLEGWWKIIESERARYEANARAPAPPPRDERRPTCPVPEAEWQAGTWVWNLEAWVWLPGVWLSTQRPVHSAAPAKR